MSEKVKKFYVFLRIFVIIGWVLFFVYNLYVANYLYKSYEAEPADFVMFYNESQRQQYLSGLPPYADKSWVNEASLVEECKPIIFINGFYFDKITPMQPFAAILIILTLVLRTDSEEWKELGQKIQKMEDKYDELDK